MTSSPYDCEVEDLALECFAQIRAASMESEEKLKAKREDVEAGIEAAIAELFGGSVRRCSIGGYARATIQIAQRALKKIDEVLEDAQDEIHALLHVR